MALALTLGMGGVASQAAHAQNSSADLSEGIAAALYDRGTVLFEQGDFLNAKKMFIESLERSPSGSRSADSLRMIRSCNEKLGTDPEDGTIIKGEEGPLDPYAIPDDGSEAAGETPLDPYADVPKEEAPVDPYASLTEKPVLPEDSDTEELDTSVYGKLGHYGMVGNGGALGASLGMAIVGTSRDDVGNESVGGGQILLSLAGAGAGAYASKYLIDKYELSDAKAAAVATAGMWTMYNFGHMANVFTGESTSVDDVSLGMALGGAIGTGLGVWIAKTQKVDVKTISLINSFSLYGTGTGLLLGVALAPPKADAYSLNAALGSVAGIGAAIYFKEELRFSRKRMLKIDMGAAAGALVPWLVFYPLMYDDQSNDDEQTTGFFSAAGIAGGAYLAWFLTKNSDDDVSLEDEGAAPEAPVSPALVHRSGAGAWSLSTPMIRPMEMPALSPRQGTMGTDILSGRF